MTFTFVMSLQALITAIQSAATSAHWATAEVTSVSTVLSTHSPTPAPDSESDDDDKPGPKLGKVYFPLCASNSQSFKPSSTLRTAHVLTQA